MKYCVIVPDGMADRPLQALDGQTPMTVASTPNMDALAARGHVGLVQTIPAGMPAGSDVANLSLMGYDPKKYYTGRAPLEALVQDIELGPRDWAFRCNFVTVADGRMADYSAGHISTPEAKLLIDELNTQLGSDKVSFYCGVSYRHLVVFRDTDPFDIQVAPPHDISGQPVKKHLPTGEGARLLCSLMERSVEVISATDINQVRIDMGENPATQIWLWGHGQAPTMPTFKETYGKTGAVITAVDLVRGLAVALDMQIIRVEGATGYLDTNYQGKGQAAIEALQDVDFVYIHVEAPDEASHGGLVIDKVKAIERVDALIVGPIIQALEKMGPHRILVMPDHVTSCDDKCHLRDPVPFVVAGENIQHVLDLVFNEDGARQSDLVIDEGYQLMEFFLRD